MEEITVERTILIEAPRERVWQAVTDPAQIAQWLLPPQLGATMGQDEAGTLFVALGPMQAALARFELLDPPQRVSTRSLPDDLLAITYRLDEEGGGTRVTVTMSGFEALPEDARQDRLSPSGRAWEKGLENLKAFVGGAELPFPEGYVAALYGYRRAFPEALAVERSVWIKAKRERVWQAITDPDQLEQWFSPGTSWSGTELAVGGRFFVRDPNTGAEMYTQVIDLLDPPHRLATRSVPQPGQTLSTTTYRLDEQDGGTRLTLIYAEYTLDESGWAMLEQHSVGFALMLLNIKAFIEGEPLPVPGGF